MKTNEFTVSQNSARFLDCLKSLETVYNKVNNALSHMYGGNYANTLLAQHYHEKHIAAKRAIQDFLCVSIDERIEYNSTEI